MSKKFKEIIPVEEFESDLKYLAKKYQILEQDLAILIETSIYAFHDIISQEALLFKGERNAELGK